METYNPKKAYCGPNKITNRWFRKLISKKDNYACYQHDTDFENGDFFGSNWRLAKRTKNPIKGYLLFYPLTMIGGTFSKIKSWF
jgi:hypothetical protein